jgi:hypothetical protein
LKIVFNAAKKCFILRIKKFCIGYEKKNSHVSQRRSCLVP